MVFMVGGKRAIFEKIKLVFDRIGKKTIYVGKSGDGATLKLVINHTLYLNQAAAIEGLVLGLKAGLNPNVLFDVITSGAASSDLLLARGKDMLNSNFSPKGPVVMANKDLVLSLETAKRLGVVLPVGALYQQLLLKAHYNGWDREDATVVMKIYEGLAGIVRKGKRSSSRMKKKG
jgi:3-hydroxyisobutyrate dehydrogenase